MSGKQKKTFAALTKVLLIYELIPEETRVYVLDVSAEDLVWMKKCHRRFSGFEMPPDNDKAWAKLSEYLDAYEKAGNAALGDKAPIDLRGFDLCIISGFSL